MSSYSGDDAEIVSEYIDFLTTNEYAFIGSLHDTTYIKDMPLKWAYFGDITNCVCEYSSLISVQIEKIIDILDNKLKCQAFQLISFDEFVPLDSLENILNHLKERLYLYHVELLIPFREEYEIEKIRLLLSQYFCINRLIIHSSPQDILEKSDHTILLYTKQHINTIDSCGVIGKDYFSLNLPHITESMRYNNCLNRKMFINKEGIVRNCPFSKEQYGNIFVDDIQDIISHKKIQKLWSISKDKIQVCKDCEFRYVCSDCRVFIKDPNNIYSQPAKCNYNPYIGKWLGEEGYITVEEYNSKSI